ncbi:hypothetical protein [Mesorhizobium sp. M0870]
MHWAANPMPWEFYDLVAVVPILFGSRCRCGLSMLLDMSSLRRPIYERANRMLMAGIILTACVALAILLDLFATSVKGTLPGA